MSTKGSSHHFDPTHMSESILGDLERKLNKSVQLMYKRLDRIENESLKRRCSIQSSRDKVPNHEFRTLKEEMDCDCALSAYEKFKHTCDVYKDNKRRIGQTSKRSSSSTKSACTFEEFHDYNRNRSTYGESMGKDRSKGKRNLPHQHLPSLSMLIHHPYMRYVIVYGIFTNAFLEKNKRKGKLKGPRLRILSLKLKSGKIKLSVR